MASLPVKDNSSTIIGTGLDKETIKAAISCVRFWGELLELALLNDIVPESSHAH